MYAIDNGWGVVAFNTTTGRQLPWRYRLPPGFWLHIAVSRSQQLYLVSSA